MYSIPRGVKSLKLQSTWRGGGGGNTTKAKNGDEYLVK